MTCARLPAASTFPGCVYLPFSTGVRGFVFSGSQTFGATLGRMASTGGFRAALSSGSKLPLGEAKNPVSQGD